MDDNFAKIFDIQRFSIHDGEGIRTTVFFKGCTLRCMWCHNPEGIEFRDYLVFSKSKCIKCRLCTEKSDGAITFDENNNIRIDYSKDFDLKEVEDICPTRALEIDSKLWSLDELVDEVLKDRIFYKYGGGITASGGECLLQSKFINKFFKILKEEGINTAIETALYVPWENVEEVIKYTDIIYFDLKIIDSEKHKRYIGADNALIIENAKKILESDYKDRVIVRTPLIPGITDDIDNITSISKFISSIYKDVKYELLNYNSFAESKYEKIGKDYELKNLNPLKINDIENLLKLVEENGVTNIINERKEDK